MRLLTHSLTFAIGFVFACIIYQLTLGPIHQESADQMTASLNEAHDAATSCQAKLSEAKGLIISCSYDLKVAVQAGEECVQLLYNLPLEIIQQVRDANK